MESFLFIDTITVMTTETSTAPAQPTLMTVVQAAAYLGFTRQTLYSWIHEGKGPDMFRPWPGAKSIRFRQQDLDAWVASRIESSADRFAS